MKQIIPLKKDIIFKTKIGEITNINIDKEYKIKDDIVDGHVKLYGTYKMTEASILEEEFNYKLPFGVSISNNIKKESIKIDIEDFNYQFNKDVLSVDIDLDFECEEYLEENNNIDSLINKEDKETIINDENNNEVLINETDELVNNNIENNITNITNLINNEENYHTYKVYIVRQGDTINDICNKYNITLKDLSEYNEINNIQVGDKIVIPYINE